MPTRFLKFATSCVLVIASATVFSPSAQACSVAVGGDNWFVANVFFDTTTLPAGVTVVGNGTPKTEFKNTTSTPLYTIDTFNNGATFPNTELPATVRPKYKAVQGRAFSYDYYTYQYVEYSGVSTIPTSIILNTTIPSGDNRPANPGALPDEPFTTNVYYGQQLVTLTGTIRFAVNQAYDPKAEEKASRVCADTRLLGVIIAWVYFVVLYVILPGGVIWLIVALVRRRRGLKNKTPGPTS